MIFLHRRAKRWLLPAITMASVSMAFATSAQTASLSPNQLGSGQLPSGYSRITFALANRNWTGAILLPTSPRNGDQVEISSSAAYPSSLDNFRAALPIKKLDIRSGDRYLLTYSSSAKAWSVSGDTVAYLSPNDTSADMSGKAKRITVYSLGNGNWLPQVNLPSSAGDGDLAVIRSSAAWTAAINPGRLMYASSMQLATGDYYVFKYLSHFGKWILMDATTRHVSARRDIPVPATARTSMMLYDGSWSGSIRLPAQAGDRDQIYLSSRATYDSVIENTGNAPTESMQLKRGQAYEFMYVKEKQRWIILSSPDTRYQARDLRNGWLPGLVTPRTFVDFADANWVPSLRLPDGQLPGSRVVVRTNALYSFDVVSDGLQYRMSQGETVAFVVNASRRWTRETTTIDLLLLYSDKAAAKFGESVMRAHLLESFALTNEALENSGANFRFRTKAVRKFASPKHWTSLGDAENELRSDSVAQAWRNELRADGIYYVGTEDGCGLAWVRSSPYNMVAAGSMNCGTAVMRHELGHNMGLNHGGGSRSYNQGYSYFGTIMGGNSIPYYSTPDRYDHGTGIPLGIPGQIDGVRAMNEFSGQAASFR
ncbi:M12 family metallo-peptidase [Dyella marensis]|uniref:M12 family metallo-peptidase n=1 Tax=Dyella marensis TaxID=500610 RepID=UPI000AFD5B49|nr:M12 family metallo-peptidase [Dyella marensis]